MGYVEPKDVRSPKNRWRLHRILFDGREDGWSAAEGQWDDKGLWKDVLAIRWNGNSRTEIGHPQSRGLATWFIVPRELEDAVREVIKHLPEGKDGP